jgi:hypothetical protein
VPLWKRWPVLAGAAAVLGLLVGVVVFLLTRSGGSTDGGGGSPGGDGGTPQPAAIAHIPDDSSAVIIFRPMQALKSPLLKPLPQEPILALLAKEEGLDLTKVEQMTAVVVVNPDKGPLSGGIVRFAGSVDSKEIFTKSLKSMKETSFEGKKYFKSDLLKESGEALAGFEADKKTLLLAPEALLKKMLKASEPKNLMVAALRKADLKGDAAGVVQLEAFRPLLKEQAKEMAKVVASMIPEKKTAEEKQAAVEKVPDQLVSVNFAVNLSGRSTDLLLKISLQAKDAAAAKEVADLGTWALVFFKKIYPDLRNALEAQFTKEKMPQDMVKAILEAADELTNSITVSQNAQQVIVNVKTPSKLANLVEKIAPLVKGLLSGPPGGGGIKEEALKEEALREEEKALREDLKKKLPKSPGPDPEAALRLPREFALARDSREPFCQARGLEDSPAGLTSPIW